MGSEQDRTSIGHTDGRPGMNQEACVGYAEDRGGYFRARYKQPDGRYGTVKDANGRTARSR